MKTTDQDRCNQAIDMLGQVCEILSPCDENVDSSVVDILADVEFAVDGLKGLNFDDDGCLIKPEPEDDDEDDYEDDDDDEDDDDE